MKKHMILMFVGLAAMTLAVACGGGGEQAAAPKEASAESPAPAASAPSGSGTVTGKAVYANGDPDTAVKMDADPVCASLHSDAVHTEKVIADESGNLANVLVYVKSGLEGKSFPAPGQSHLLDQVGCQYKPHVSGMMVGQKLVIRNSDPTLHNVHALPAVNKEFNQGQPFQGMELEHTFDEAEVMVRFKCDVHPWMSSFMAVLEHPFFGVSAADGSFAIENLPAGDYVLEAWHEEFGTRAQNVSVAEGGAVEVSFDFSPGAAAPAG